VAEAVATAEWPESDRWPPASRLDDLDDFDDDFPDDRYPAGDHYPPGELVAAVPAQRTVETHQVRGGAAPAGTQRDLRDRLVSVLLLDHEAAVGALDALAACQQRLAKLTEATRAERAQLAGLLTRLCETGLSPEQLARLADLPLDEVRGHLMTRR
jgi:hypothetical protein